MGFLNQIINVANTPIPEWEPAEPTHRVVLHWCTKYGLFVSGKLEEWPLDADASLATARKNQFQWETPLAETQHPHGFLSELTIAYPDCIKFEGTSRDGRHHTAIVLAQRISPSCYVMVEALKPEVSTTP